MKDNLYPLRKAHGRLHDWWTDYTVKLRDFTSVYKERICKPHAVYLVYTPEHKNLGDHAIAKSEIELLNRLGIPFIEVTGRKLGEWKNKGYLHFMNGRAIFVNGGGNLGTIWPDVEETIRCIIKSNPRSNIVIYPSSFFYEDDENGRKELEESKRYYNSSNVKIYAREHKSYEAMKRVYKNVSIAPDMVLRMNECKNGMSRHGGILCLRTDREKTLSTFESSVIFNQMRQLFGNDTISLDMLKPYSIPVNRRNAELEKQYDAFRHAELVITDRLHGMIFCVITGTPCIVVDSKSPKVRGCYEWIKDLPYIQFCEDVNQIASIYHSISKEEWTYDETRLLPLYHELESDIMKAAKGRRICQ